MKNIIVCCDGTGNEFESNVTNVVETYALATKNAQQVVFYDPGVGTGGWQYDEGTGKLRAVKDLATGGGLQKNIGFLTQMCARFSPRRVGNTVGRRCGSARAGT